MKYFEFSADTPYTGTESIDYYAFEDDVTTEELEQLAEELNEQNAEGYEYLVTGWDDDEYDDEDERQMALDDYYAECCCTYKEITKEEYDENN